MRKNEEQPDQLLCDAVAALRHKVEEIKTQLVAARHTIVDIQVDCSTIYGWVTDTAKEFVEAEELDRLAFCLEGTGFIGTLAGLDATLSFIDDLAIDLRFIGDGYLAFGGEHSPPPPTCTQRLWAWLRAAGYEDVPDDRELPARLEALRQKARNDPPIRVRCVDMVSYLLDRQVPAAWKIDDPDADRPAARPNSMPPKSR